MGVKPCKSVKNGENVDKGECGQDAPIEAAMKADELLEAGDLDGYAMWRRIVKAVGVLVPDEFDAVNDQAGRRTRLCGS